MKRRVSMVATLLAVATALSASAAQAATAPPEILDSWVTNVSSVGANLRAEIIAHELVTDFHFEYTTEAEYLEHGFEGARDIPAGEEATIGSGNVPIAVVQHPSSLEGGTSYRFRVVAKNGDGTVFGPVRSVTADEVGIPFALPDERGWEMVSPVSKNGGEIQGFGGNFGGGVFQAAEQGGEITYSSTSSFGSAQGSPGASQYVSTRSDSGWNTDNVTIPMLSGTYSESPTAGVPYQVFSPDLGSGLVSNGRRCRSSAPELCPAENAPLADSNAPAGYRNYYLRSGTGDYSAVLGAADLGTLALADDEFEIAFAGATPDLSSIVLSTCAALTPGATEVAGVGGECNPTKQNLYVKTGNDALRQVNTAPGSSLAAQSGAISSDGSRVYWTDGKNLHVRDGSVDKQVDSVQGGGGTFQTASADGSVAYFSKAGHLYRYTLPAGTTADLTPGGGLLGVLGASADGDYVYYSTTDGLFLDHEGALEKIADSVTADSYPPTTGTARVSTDGRHLVFVSTAADVADYDNRDVKTNVREPEVYRFAADGPAPRIFCASCNPSGERPVGGSQIPGAIANGGGELSPYVYKPRILSASADRVFFESMDELVTQDTNNGLDVYQWEADGSGNCTRGSGCVGLISSGRAQSASTFVDASADGSDAYFLTVASLVSTDPGVRDIYDARVGGGFPDPPKGIPCFGDACQPLPPEPEDPTPGTVRQRKSGNLPLSENKPLKCKKNQVKRFGKCVKKPKKKHHKKGKR